MRRAQLTLLVALGTLLAWHAVRTSAAETGASKTQSQTSALEDTPSAKQSTSSVRNAQNTPAVELPPELRGGEATTHVYLGIREQRAVYVGITTNLRRRQAQHGGRFVLVAITEVPVTRGEARAIEQAVIAHNPGFENIRNSISPKHPYYQQAVRWGEAWLEVNGIHIGMGTK